MHFNHCLLSGEAGPTFGHANAIFCVYGPYKKSIPIEINNVSIFTQVNIRNPTL